MKEFSPFRLDTVNECLWRGEDPVPLTPKAYRVLRYLVEHAGKLVAQQELLEALWPNTYVQPGILKAHILDLRKALGDDPREPSFIQTLPRRGYRFIAGVNEIAAADPNEAGTERLVGREGPLGKLWACLEKALAGERQILFVSGEVGIGKTALVDVFERRAESGARGVHIARGQCVEGFGRREPYYPLLEALGRLGRGRDGDAIRRELEAQAPTWLVQFPAFVGPEQRQSLQREIMGATRDRMLREICVALERIAAELPLVFLLEDLQWVDHSTLDVISALARRRGKARLMLVSTARDAELALADHPLEGLRRDLVAHQLSSEIRLEPLDEPAVESYVRGRQSEHADGLAKLVYRRSEGNPLFMVALVERMAGLGWIEPLEGGWRLVRNADEARLGVPENLRQNIELQIERVREIERRVLEAASVAGVRFAAHIVARSSGIKENILHLLCENLARKHRLIRAAAGQCYEFVHSFYREVLYERMAQARRAQMHLRVGLEIEAALGEQAGEMASELANHFEQAGEWSKAIHYLRLAAENATRRLALREGIPLLKHALELVGRLPGAGRPALELDILERLGSVYLASYDPEALPALETLAERARRHGSTQTEVRALLYIIPVVARTEGREHEAAKIADRVLDLNAKQKDPLIRAETRLEVMFWRMLSIQWEEREAEVCREALDEIVRGGNAAAALLRSHIRGFLLWASSRYREALRLAQKNLPLLLDAGMMSSYLYMELTLVWGYQYLGDLGAALDALEAAIAAAEKNGNPTNARLMRALLAWVLLDAFDYAAGRDICRRLLPEMGAHETPTMRLCWNLAGAAEAGLGNTGRAFEILLKDRERGKEPFLMNWYHRMLASVGLMDSYLTLNDLPSAHKHGREFLDIALGTADRTWQARAWEANARIALAEGELARASECIANALAAMDGFETPLAHWRVHATAAELHQRLGDESLAGRHREQSAGTIRALGDSLVRHERVRAQFLSAPAVRKVLGLAIETQGSR